MKARRHPAPRSSHNGRIAPPQPSPPTARFRLAEAIAALSLATDLGMGQPMDKCLRSAILSTALGRRMGLGPSDLSDVYHLALLVHVGCTATALEWERISGGNDLGLRAINIAVVSAPVEEIGPTVAGGIVQVAPPERRDALLGELMAHPEAGRTLLQGQCEAAQLLVAQMGLPGSLIRAAGQIYERWDGHGSPHGLGGEEIDIRVRVVQVAHDAETFERERGLAACLAELRRRAGQGGFDPGCVAAAVEDAAELFAALPAEDAWAACLAVEPGPVRLVGEADLDRIAEGFGQFADLKIPHTLGHSSGVAALAHDAALAAGLDAREAATIRRAGLLHDIGRIGVANGIWSKPGPLTEAEFERVRLHPYYTERVLSRPGILAPLAGLAAGHHERLDGSGYFRGLDASRLSTASRILAAADACQAMTQPRPHRPALAPAAAAAELRAEAGRGRLDQRAVAAVLEAAGQGSAPRRRPGPAGLSEREIEVLRLLCAGRTNQETADLLHLSPKTVGRHIENIYAKAGVNTRASVTLFALQHGLVGDLVVA